MNDEHQIAVQHTKLAAAEGLVGQINRTYAECKGCDDQIRDLVIRKCNKARDCGILLQSYRKDCAHGKWRTLFRLDKNQSSFAFDFSEETARNFIRYAKANPNPIISLPEAIGSLWEHMVATGAIAPPQGHGDQQRAKLTWLDHISLAMGRARELFNGHLEKSGGDIRSLPASERAVLKAKLRPTVELWEML